MAHPDNPESDEIRLFAASLAHDPDGIELPYLVLDHVATRHHLAEAVLVLRPGTMAPQLFSRGRVPLPADQAGDLLARPVGLYTEPDVIEPTVRAALAGICSLALAADVIRRAGALDEASGLASRAVIESSLIRAASSGARYGWSFTAVLLTTGGEGTAAERWNALSTALRVAARVGDEMGVAGPGRALAILGNAGPDVVRPFVARVRAALNDAGHVTVDLHAATVTSPMETVDPEAIWELLGVRLDELVGPTGRENADRPAEAIGAGRGHLLPAALELALRSLPNVVSVGTAPHPSGVGYQIEVVAMGAPEALAGPAARRAREHRADAPVVIVPCGSSTGGPGATALTMASATVSGLPWATAGSSGNGSARTAVAVVDTETVAPTSPGPGAESAAEHVAAPEHPAPAAPSGQLTATGPLPATGAPTVAAPAAAAAAADDGAADPVAIGAAAPPAAAMTSTAAGPLTSTSTTTATAPAGAVETSPNVTAAASAPNRVTLVRSDFNPDTGTSEVHLSQGGAVGIGRATVGPLAGGAQATLAALAELGIRIPYYLVSAERAHTVPGEPVVVVLAPRKLTEASSDPSVQPPAGSPPGTPGPGTPPLAERMGVATGPDDVGASARATLSALNRFLGAVGASDR